jgi:transposase
MIRVHLPDDELHRLEHAFRAAADRKVRDRLRIVLMANRARRPGDSALALGVSTRSVPRWLNAYLERGSDGLTPRKAKGAAATIPNALADAVRRWVIDGPAAGGLDRANWSCAELADHLYKVHGVRASRSTVLRFCKKRGVRADRPT